MGNPYPANVLDGGGNIRISGAVDFTDAENQPGGGAVVISATEPAETAAGMLWIQTGVEPPTIYERSDANDAWAQVYPTVAAGLGDVLSTSGDAGGGAITNIQSITGSGGEFNTGGGDLDVGGGTLKTSSGNIETDGGSISLGGAPITGLDDPSADDDADTKGARNAAIAGIAPPATPDLAAVLAVDNDANGGPITGLGDPAVGTDAVPRDWANDRIGGVTLGGLGDGFLSVTSGVMNNATKASFVANGSTVDQLRDSLIAAGFMDAS